MKGNTLDSLKHCYLLSTIEIKAEMRFVHGSTTHSDDLSRMLWRTICFKVEQKDVTGSKKVSISTFPFCEGNEILEEGA